jgi:hypothetical protein
MDKIFKIIKHHSVQKAYRAFVVSALGVFLVGTGEVPGVNAIINAPDISTQKAAALALVTASVVAGLRAVAALAVAELESYKARKETPEA